MAIPIEPSCWKNLFTMSLTLGGVLSQAAAEEKPIWDKGALGFMGLQLIELLDDCELGFLCNGYAQNLATVLSSLLLAEPEVNPVLVDAELAVLGDAVTHLTGCMMQAYAIAPDARSMEGGMTLSEWPDEDWLMEVYPQRLRTVR